MATTMTRYGRVQALYGLGLSGYRYVSLHSGTPGDSGNSEVTDTNYARQQGYFQVDESTGEAVTTADLTWPAAVNGYTVSHVGLWDSQSGGNLVAFLPMNSSQNVAPDAVFTIPAREITIGGA